MKYTDILHVRISDEISAMLGSNVKKSGNINVSKYIREVIQRDYIERISEYDVADFKNIERQLIGLGNNVNQIAHNMNMDLYTPEDADQLRICMMEISEIRKTIRELKRKLG